MVQEADVQVQYGAPRQRMNCPSEQTHHLLGAVAIALAGSVWETVEGVYVAWRSGGASLAFAYRSDQGLSHIASPKHVND